MIALTGGKYGGYVLDNASVTLYDENNEIVDSVVDFLFTNNTLVISGWKYLVENGQAIFDGIE